MRLFNCLYKVSRQSQATQAFKILSKSLFFSTPQISNKYSIQVSSVWSRKMQLHNQPLNQTFLSCPVLGSRVLLECLCFQVPIPKFLLLMVATHAASSSLTVTVREHFPSNQMQELWRELKGMVMSHIPKKEGKGRGRERSSLNLGIYLLKHRKEHASRHHFGRNPSTQGCGASLPARICLKLHKSLLPLSLTHRSELRSALHCQPKCISGLMKV